MNINKIILLSTSLLISTQIFAADYKGVVTTHTTSAQSKTVMVTNRSLEGWNGEFPACVDGAQPPCWNALVPPYVDMRIWRPVVSLGGGFVKTRNIGSAESFGVETPGGEFFVYNPSNPNQSGAIADIFLGFEWRLNSLWHLQGGLNFNQVASQYDANGVVTQGTSSTTEQQFSYNYTVTTRQFLAASKLLYTLYDLYHPYVFLGLGAAYNDAYDFTTSVPAPQTFTRLYNDNTNTSFVFNVGCGLDINLTDMFRLGLGYRFTDLGEVKLGKAYIGSTEVSGTLSQTHMYSNVFLAQITLLF